MIELWCTARQALTGFLSWWLGELAGLLPRWVRGAPASAKNGLVLEISHDEATLLERTARRGEREIDRIADLRVNDGSVDLSALSDARYRKWPLAIRLRDDLGLRKIVELPIAARNDLNQLLQFELDRLTPFKADDVCFAWRILETHPDKGKIQVELEMAPKAIVERGLTLIDSRGRKADRIELRAVGNREPLDLMPRTAALREHGQGRAKRFLTLLVLVLAVAAVVIPLRNQQQRADRLEEEIILIRAEAEESLVMRERLDGLAQEARFLTDAKNHGVSMTDVLAELTRLLPDESFIVQLNIGDSKIELNGLARKASDLIAILDRSPMLTSPQFQSPVTRDARSGKERFQISIDLTGHPS